MKRVLNIFVIKYDENIDIEMLKVIEYPHYERRTCEFI